MTAEKILNQVLKEISLSKAEEAELKKIATDFTKKIPNSSIGGSLAKGTLIKKKEQDIDIFVSFNTEEETKNLGKILAKKAFKTKKLHGSRDYFQIKKKNNTYLEVVPVVQVKNLKDVENVTDFSLSHVKYIKNKIKLNKNLADQIKLAKVFCYASNCYGAESYIKGFSGYALELLIIHFKTFTNFLKQIQKKNYIDIEKSFKSERQARNEINTSKLTSPILLVDPTYKYRNAAAGLSEQTFSNFLVIAKKFLKKPSKEFFTKKQFNIEEFKKTARKNKTKFISITLTTNRQEGDIAGTKMKKFFRFLIAELERKQQKVTDSHFEYSGEGKKAKAYLSVKSKPVIEVRGPSILDKHAIKEFKKVRKKIFKKASHVWAKEAVTIDSVLKQSMRNTGEMGVVSFLWQF